MRSPTVPLGLVAVLAILSTLVANIQPQLLGLQLELFPCLLSLFGLGLLATSRHPGSLSSSRASLLGRGRLCRASRQRPIRWGSSMSSSRFQRRARQTQRRLRRAIQSRSRVGHQVSSSWQRSISPRLSSRGNHSMHGTLGGPNSLLKSLNLPKQVTGG